MSATKAQDLCCILYRSWESLMSFLHGNLPAAGGPHLAARARMSVKDNGSARSRHSIEAFLDGS